MQRKIIEKIYLQKIKELIRHDKSYFEHDKPIIPDRDYDILRKDLQDKDSIESKEKYVTLFKKK